jgi:transposase InsO family protein
LPIAPSTYYRLKRFVKHPQETSRRRQSDEYFRLKIRRVWEENHEVYGARKVWRQLQRDGFHIARYTTERLMKPLRLRGVTRGLTGKRTTIASLNHSRHLDLVRRAFCADRPNQLWVADFTYVATWSGFIFVPFIIDAFSRMIVGWRAMKTMITDMTLDSLEQAIWARKVKGNLIAVEYATLDWISWFNTKRFLEPIGNIPPAEYEKLYYIEFMSPAQSAGLT